MLINIFLDHCEVNEFAFEIKLCMQFRFGSSFNKLKNPICELEEPTLIRDWLNSKPSTNKLAGRESRLQFGGGWGSARQLTNT